MKRNPIIRTALLSVLSFGLITYSERTAAQLVAGRTYQSGSDLDQLLAPVALYADPLIAEILPAAAYPSEIVVADRYVSGGGDPNAIDLQPWDPSVKAIARYPSVLRYLDDNLSWTTALGQAFLSEPQDVMDSIQHLRSEALALGNLQSNSEQTVITDNGTIEILPANPQVIYVPSYQPEVVYYERPYRGPLITFGPGLPIGGWLDRDFDWRNHHLLAWDREHPRPPTWWARRPGQPRPEIARAPVWHPEPRPFPRPDMDRGWGERSPRNFANSSRPSGPTMRPEPARRETPPMATARPGNATPSRDFQSSRSQTPTRELPATPPQTSTRELPSTASRTRPEQSSPSQSAQRSPPQNSQPSPSQPTRNGSYGTRSTAGGAFGSQPSMGREGRPATGALVGVQSSHDTAQFSSRGQSSRMAAGPPAMSHSAPASQPSHSSANSGPSGPPDGRRPDRGRP